MPKVIVYTNPPPVNIAIRRVNVDFQHGSEVIEGRLIDVNNVALFTWYRKPVVVFEFQGVGLRPILNTAKYSKVPFALINHRKFINPNYPLNVADKIETLLANKVSVVTGFSFELMEEIQRRCLHYVLVYPSLETDQGLWVQRMRKQRIESHLIDETMDMWKPLLTGTKTYLKGTHVVLENNEECPKPEFFVQ